MATEKTTEKNVQNKPKMVKIKLPLTRGETDDVYVAVNGNSFLIKRGEEVEVPSYVVDVLEHKEKMLAKSLEYESQASANANY